MNELNDFESSLRVALRDTERALVEPSGLAERLIDRTAGRTSVLAPRRAPWFTPLLAAAAVVAVVVASLVGVQLARHTTPATSHTPQPTPSISQSVVPPSPTPTATTKTSPPTSHSSSPSVYGPVGTRVPSGYVGATTNFISADVGWSLGNRPCSQSPGYCATLLRTVDGGKTWRSIPVPKGLTPVDDQGHASGGSCGDNGNVYGPCVDGVTFADEHTGYLWSFHSLFMTTDGGSHWTNLQRHASNLVISDGRVITWSYIHECSAGCAGRMDTAPLGSTHWQQVSPGGYQSALFSSTLVSAGSNAYFFSIPLSAVSDYQGITQTSVFRSTDGGRTWNRRSLGSACGADASGAPDGTLVVQCTNSQSTTRPLVSLDGGRTFHAWTSTPTLGLSANDATQLQSSVIAVSADALVVDVYDSRTTPYRGHLFRLTSPTGAWVETGSYTANSVIDRELDSETSPAGGPVATESVLESGSGSFTLITADGGKSWQQLAYRS